MVIIKEPPVGMSVAEAAQEAGVSTATLYSLAAEGRLPGARRLGRRIIVHRQVFMEWLKAGSGE